MHAMIEVFYSLWNMKLHEAESFFRS